MNGLLVASRSIHFVALAALFGEFVYVIFVAGRALPGEPQGRLEARYRRLRRVAGWSLAAAVASGALWFMAQAAAMSGMSFEAALNPKTLDMVLEQTRFGRLFEFRLGLALALATGLFLGARTSGVRAQQICTCCGGLLSGALLASLAGTGHAAAERGTDALLHMSADALHLLGAGAWLGALLPFALVLRHALQNRQGLALAARATSRFSVLGALSVGALLISGAVNTWYTAGSVPALLGTDYGRLLILKLLLFAAMISIAAVNRLHLAPRIAAAAREARAAPQALRCLARNALIEWVFGVAVLVLVSMLGVTVPALHIPASPSPYALSLLPGSQFAGIEIALIAAGLGVLALGFIGLRGGRRTLPAPGWVAIAAIAALGRHRREQ